MTVPAAVGIRQAYLFKSNEHHLMSKVLNDVINYVGPINSSFCWIYIYIFNLALCSVWEMFRRPSRWECRRCMSMAFGAKAIGKDEKQTWSWAQTTICRHTDKWVSSVHRRAGSGRPSSARTAQRPSTTWAVHTSAFAKLLPKPRKFSVRWETSFYILLCIYAMCLYRTWYGTRSRL